MRSRSRILLILATSFLFLVPATSRAAGGDFGLGLIIGSPTGLSAKYYLAEGHALDFAVGGATVGNRGIHVHADYLWHPWILTREASFDLAAYVGVGGRLLDHNRSGDNDDFHIGVRGPVGIVFDFVKADVPIDVFAEVALVLDLVVADEDDNHDAFNLDLNAGIGVRYYF